MSLHSWCRCELSWCSHWCRSCCWWDVAKGVVVVVIQL